MSYANLATVEVEGVDGSVWRLHGAGAGAEGVRLGTSPSGIYDAPVRTVWQQGAFQEGSSPLGPRWDARDVVFVALVSAKAGRSWQDVDSEWRRAWSYTADSILRVTTPSGTRELRLRLLEAPGFTPETDPRINSFGEVVMTCRAGDPFWLEQPNKQYVQSTTGAGQATVTVVNPTDKEMYLRWVMTPGARWTLPDFDFLGGNRAITLPTAFTSREVTVDTHPLEEQVTVPDWANAWEAMGGVQFVHWVPPHTPPTVVPVQWTGSNGVAALMCVEQRRWSRPWGLE